MIPEHIKKRYYRKVIAGEGIWHHGDCRIFGLKRGVCTCGLLHDLLPCAGEAEEIYPSYWEDIKKHDRSLSELQELGRAAS